MVMITTFQLRLVMPFGIVIFKKIQTPDYRYLPLAGVGPLRLELPEEKVNCIPKKVAMFTQPRNKPNNIWY